MILSPKRFAAKQLPRFSTAFIAYWYAMQLLSLLEMPRADL